MTPQQSARPTARAAVQVARCHLGHRRFVVLPWAIFALVFAINLLIAGLTPGDPHHVGGVVAIFVVMFALGLISAVRFLPFMVMLGASRRAYLLGALSFAATVAIVDGLALAILQAIERATDGWGVTLHFLRLSHVLDGSFALTWLTAALGLLALFVYGLLFGIVYRRWDTLGLLALIGGQLLAALVAGGIVATTRSWGSVGRLLGGVQTADIAGLLVVLLALVLAASWASARRIAV